MHCDSYYHAILTDLKDIRHWNPKHMTVDSVADTSLAHYEAGWEWRTTCA